MMERLGWAAAAFLLIWLAHRLVRIYQRHGLQPATPFSGSGQVNLILVVSSRCAVCPAQKRVVAQLGEKYPPSQLRVITIDAETQVEQARQLSVMTVPSTLLQAPDGTMVHINNGYIALAPLARQIERLMPENAE